MIGRTVLLLAALCCQQAAAEEPSWAELQSIPAWAADALRAAEFTRDYSLSDRLNPFLLHGDFDGDHRLDVALLVSRRGSGSQGIAILHRSSARPLVVGAGRALGSGGEDFSWMDAWSVFPKGSLERGPGLDPPQLLGDALYVQKLESASAIVYWDGTAYRWHQQGD